MTSTAWEKTSRIYVAGHNGMVGSSIVRQLHMNGFRNLILKDRLELDLTNSNEVESFFSIEKPEYVILAAAKVGGIVANNTYPAEFLYENCMIQNNVIHASYKHNVTRLLFLGSSCIYPKESLQPIREEYLLTGMLEPTNRPYAIAKISGVEMCWSYNRQYNTKYVAAMPTNLYGPGDNYHPENSHVIPGLIRKFHQAKVEESGTVKVWGSGSPMREFLYVDDMARACIFLMSQNEKEYSSLLASDRNNGTPPIVNIGTGVDISIRELAYLIAEVTGFQGEITFDTTKPDGTMKKLLDVSRLKNLGYEAAMSLKEGLTITYDFFLTEELRER